MPVAAARYVFCFNNEMKICSFLLLLSLLSLLLRGFSYQSGTCHNRHTFHLEDAGNRDLL